MLSLLKESLERRLSPSTLKVHVAAIAAHHDAVDGRSLGKHDLIVRFLKVARRMNPSRQPLVPSWDFSIVLAGLQRGPFEQLDSVELKFLSAKTVLLIALTSIKKVGDLQAFSVSEECLVFGPVYSHVVLRPLPGYVPKVPTTPFSGQVVNLQALPSEETDPALALLCPVRALRIYVDRTWSFRSSEQLFVWSAERKGCLQTEVGPLDSGCRHAWEEATVPISRWAVPPGGWGLTPLRVLPLHALAHGASPADTCRAAGWATRTPSQDSTVSALSQSLPVCWVTGNGREELAGVGEFFLRWGDGKVATSCMAFVCHALVCQHLHATRLWRGSACGTFHRTPMSSRHNSQWPTDREHLGYVRNPRSLMEGTETLCPHASILNHRWLPGTRSRLSVKPNEWMHLSPFYTRMHWEWLRYAKSTSQFHWSFLLKSEMIGASR